MQSIQGLQDISSLYDHYIVDIWGVVHNGLALYPGTLDAFDRLKAMGKQVILLSNSPRRAHEVQDQLETMGLGAHHYHGIHTSGEETYDLLKEHQGKWQRVYPLMSVGRHTALQQELTELGFDCVDDVEQADLLLNTGPDNLVVELYGDFLKEALAHKVPMLCANPDVAAYVGNERIVCAGALANAYAVMGGEVLYVGKPYPLVYERIFQLFSAFDLGRAVGVGDGLMTDILGAHTMKMASVLIGTGLGRETPMNESLKPTYQLAQLRW
ncbi:MAG: TIGR01459 family HAD-type hydrolase [Holosporales bacterium]